MSTQPSDISGTERYRFSIRMQPVFRTKYPKAEVIGAPFREQLGDDVIVAGFVVEWIDEEDGGVTLIIEAKSR